MTEPTRILELWPSLTETQRTALLTIAEAAAQSQSPLLLSSDEANALVRAKEEFASGRSLSIGDAEKATDDFLRGLRVRA
jgi:hypothetical protein